MIKPLTQADVIVLEAIASDDAVETVERIRAFKQLVELNPTYHYCYEWDELLISDKDPEFSVCMCFK